MSKFQNIFVLLKIEIVTFYIIFINIIMVYITTIENFNKITENDIELIFDDKFNQNVIIPNSIEILKFGDNFNKKIIIPTFLLHKKLNKVEVGV